VETIQPNPALGIDESLLMQQVRRMRIKTRRRVNSLFAGAYRSAFKGRGIEFAEVREYEPGDDIRSIDWNVTARAGKPFIKRFEEERELTVALLVDVSASSVFGTTERTKMALAIEAAAVVALTAQANNDRACLLTYSDRSELYLPPRKTRNHLQRITRELLAQPPHGRGSAAGPAIEDLGRLLHQKAVVFYISDFTGPSWSADQSDPSARSADLALRRLSRAHEVIALRLSDPGEREMPAIGLVELSDPETGERVLVDSSSRRVRTDLRRRVDAARAAAATILQRAGVDLVELSTDRPPSDDLGRYFRLRERRRQRE